MRSRTRRLTASKGIAVAQRPLIRDPEVDVDSLALIGRNVLTVSLRARS